MARIPLALGSYRHRSLPVSAQRLLNWFVEQEPKDSKAPLVLLPTPGLTLFAALPAGPVRGMQVMGSYLYAVAGGTVFRVDVTGAVATLGSVTVGGPVSMANNGTQMAIVVPETGEAWIATTTALTQITHTDFQAAQTVAVMDGFAIFSKNDSTEFFISALNDMGSYDAADFASAEGDPDNIVALRRVGLELWLFGERTTEIWSNTGAADFPFQRISGAFVERGCAARHSVAQRLGVPFWLGDDRVVYKGNGQTPERISTHAQEQAIAGYAVVSDARAWIYEQEGHVFYTLTFPSAGATWVYDLTTGVWHERESEGYGLWRCIVGVQFGGAVIAGDARNGSLYVVDPTAYDEAGEQIIRVATGSPLHAESKRITFKALTLDMETGVGLESGQGSNPQVFLSWSDDGGRSFGSEVWRSLGAIGAYRQRVRFSRLGSGRARVFRVTMADPVRTSLMAMEMDAEPGAS